MVTTTLDVYSPLFDIWRIVSLSCAAKDYLICYLTKTAEYGCGSGTMLVDVASLVFAIKELTRFLIKHL